MSAFAEGDETVLSTRVGVNSVASKHHRTGDVQFCGSLLQRLQSRRQFFIYLNSVFFGEQGKYRVHPTTHFT